MGFLILPYAINRTILRVQFEAAQNTHVRQVELIFLVLVSKVNTGRTFPYVRPFYRPWIKLLINPLSSVPVGYS